MTAPGSEGTEVSPPQGDPRDDPRPPALDLPRPTVSGAPAASGVPTGSGRVVQDPVPRKSSTRFVVYAAIFGCLAVLSLLLRAQTHPTPAANPNGSASHPAGANPSTTSSVGTAAPSAIVDSEFARQACTRPDVLQGGFRLVAAFETTASVAAGWEDALSQGSFSSTLHQIDPSAKVAVCYIDGPWQPPQSVADLYHSQGLTADRGLIFVPASHDPVAGPIAPHESLPILRPSAPPSAAPPVTPAVTPAVTPTQSA